MHINTADYIRKVCYVICSNEGYFGSVNRNDNLSLSIGALQWHGYRAKILLNLLISKNEEQAQTILSGTSILSDLSKDDDFWNNRTASPEESKLLSRLLKTAEGIQAQNELLAIDVKKYVQHGISLGITDLQVLAYFADLENQGGPIRAEKITRTAGTASQLTLNDLHQAALADKVLGRNKPRRNLTYTRIVNTLPSPFTDK